MSELHLLKRTAVCLRVMWCLTLIGLAACAISETALQATSPFGTVADADATRLAALGEQVVPLARREANSDVILRQVDTDLNQTTFRFTNSGATKEIDVWIPAPDAAVDQWKIDTATVTPLVGFIAPSLDLHTLRAGPQRVAQAITTHWPGCSLHGLTLYLNDNRQLIWTAFCNTPQGRATGDMDNVTGVFQPSVFPPAPLPVTATPIPY